MIGTICRPDFVAPAPSTVWRNSGKNVIAPNIEIPTIAEAEAATRKIGARRSWSGMMGSVARASAKMNRPSRTAVAANRPRMTPDPQAKLVPPHDKARINALAAPPSSAAPV